MSSLIKSYKIKDTFRLMRYLGLQYVDFTSPINLRSVRVGLEIGQEFIPQLANIYIRIGLTKDARNLLSSV